MMHNNTVITVINNTVINVLLSTLVMPKLRRVSESYLEPI